MHESKANEIAHDVQQVLADLGLCQLVRAGKNRFYRVAPSFKRVVTDEDGQYLALHFDPSRLPRNVTAAMLRQQQITDTVARRIGKSVQVRGDEEVVYIVSIEYAPTAQATR